MKRLAFSALLWCVACALGQSLVEAQEPAPLCANRCRGKVVEQHDEPRLGLTTAKVVGFGAGLAAGLALGDHAQPFGAAPALKPMALRDGIIFGSAALALVSPSLFEKRAPDLSRDRLPDCGAAGSTEDGLNGLDRSLRSLAVKNRSLEKRELLDRVSWATLSATLGQSLGVVASSGASRRFHRDVPILLEAVAVSMGVNQVVKHLVHRPRPFAHYCDPQDATDLCAEDAQLSFYSGHTSTSFVAAVAAGEIANLHGFANRKWIWGTGLTLATTTGVLRMTADKHYATDVLAGLVAGGLTGWLIPKLHKPDPGSDQSAAASTRSGRDAPDLMTFPLALGRPGSMALIGGSVTGTTRSLSLRVFW